MTNFIPITPFEFVRRLALAGREVPSVYLLIIVEPATTAGIQTDLLAEIKIQLGTRVRSMVASSLQPERLDDAFKPEADRPVILVSIDRWVPRLIRSMDRNVVLLTRGGAILLLANRALAERVLSAAPHLRNRLVDVLEITPDSMFGGLSA
ncbi:MAG: hypothetical protein ABSC05_04555 [Candidatus Solibacter sp.]|jgi:citrate lyase gamma subunit